ncbi:MAG: hypothetical protein E6K80_06195, partial [Candidatus Eisenbacteria bacterium]
MRHRQHEIAALGGLVERGRERDLERHLVHRRGEPSPCRDRVHRIGSMNAERSDLALTHGADQALHVGERADRFVIERAIEAHG